MCRSPLVTTRNRLKSPLFPNPRSGLPPKSPANPRHQKFLPHPLRKGSATPRYAPRPDEVSGPRGTKATADKVTSRRYDMFYSLTIVVLNALGTVLGDFTADKTGLNLGFQKERCSSPAPSR